MIDAAGREVRIRDARRSEAANDTDFDTLHYFSSLGSLAAHFEIDYATIGPSLCPFFTESLSPGWAGVLCICDHCLPHLTGCRDLLLAAIISVRVVAVLCLHCVTA